MIQHIKWTRKTVDEYMRCLGRMHKTLSDVVQNELPTPDSSVKPAKSAKVARRCKKLPLYIGRSNYQTNVNGLFVVVVQDGQTEVLEIVPEQDHTVVIQEAYTNTECIGEQSRPEGMRHRRAKPRGGRRAADHVSARGVRWRRRTQKRR